MKNIFLGIVGVFITLYTLLISLDIYSIQTEKNILQMVTSRSVEHALQSYYKTQDSQLALADIQKELTEAIAEGNTIEINAKEIDLEKGLLSICVTENISLITGGVKQITIEKTVIMERIDVRKDMVSVTFYVDGEIYKEYHLTRGEVCPLPKPPEGLFSGWVEYGGESMEPVESIGKVWEDKCYLAIAE